MSTSIGALVGTVSLEDRFSNALDGVLNRTSSFINRLDSGVGRLAAGFGIVSGAIAAVAGTIGYMGTQGSKLNDLDRSFEKLAGGIGNANAIMRAMNKGVADTVDSTDLLGVANRALGTGAIRTAEQFGVVAAAARAYSRDGLGSVEKNLGIVSNALASGNTRQLRYLTGIIDTTKAEQELAKQLGVGTSELTQRQKQEAARTAILDKMSEKVRSAGALEVSFAERITQVRLAVANWFDDVNKRVAALPSIGRAFEAITGAINKNFGGGFKTLADVVVDFIDRFAKNVEKYGPTVIDWAARAWQWIKDIGELVKVYWDLVPDWIKTIGAEAIVTGVALKLVAGATTSVGGGLVEMGGSIGGSISGFRDLLSMTKDLGTSLKDLYKAGIGAEILGWLHGIELAAGAAAGTFGLLAGAVGAVVGAVATIGFMDKGVLGGRGTQLAGDIERVLFGPKKMGNRKVIGDLNIMGIGPGAPGFLAGGSPDLRDPATATQGTEALAKQAAERAAGYWDEYFTFIDRRTVGELEQKENAIDRWYQREKATLEKLKLAHSDYTRAVAALDALRIEKLVDAQNTVIPSRPMPLGSMQPFSAFPGGEGLPSFVPSFIPPIGANPNPLGGAASPVMGAFSDAFQRLPSLLISSFTGGGDWKGALQSVGVSITDNLFGKDGALKNVTKSVGDFASKGLSKVFGSSIGKMLGDGVAAFMPGLGGLVGPLLEKALPKVKEFFGGPSQKELKGRDLAKTFEESIGKALTVAQRAEAGTEKWRQTTVGVRDMYLDAGLTIEDARAATERLWAATKQGEEAVQAVINQINATKELSQARKDLKDIEKQLGAQQLQNMGAVLAILQDQEAAARMTGRELNDLGIIAVASFGAAIEAGMSFSEALRAAGPGLANLQQAFEAVGITADDEFVAILARLGRIQQQNPALVAGIDALGDSFSALNALGRLTPETFAAIERTGSSMYSRIQSEVAALGGGTEDALALMQDYLHRAEKAARDLGIPLDANTQRLIDQSKELNIWQETGKSATDILIDKMTELTDRIADLIEQILGVPDINVGVNYTDPGLPDPGNPDPAPGGQNGLLPRYLSGGQRPVIMTPRGADIYPAMIRADETVLTPNQYHDTVASAFSQGAAAGSLRGEMFVETVVMVGEEVFARQVRKVQDKDVRMRRKVRGA